MVSPQRLGLLAGRCVENGGRPSPDTRALVVEEGGFLYDCDAYNDELPYWALVGGRPHLVICHALDTNDSRFTRAQGFDLAERFFS